MDLEDYHDIINGEKGREFEQERAKVPAELEMAEADIITKTIEELANFVGD